MRLHLLRVAERVFAAGAVYLLLGSTAVAADALYDFSVREMALGDVVERVKELTGHELAGGWFPMRERRISVSVEQTTIKELVRAICRAAGLTYNRQSDRFWYLRPGDVDADPRPRVEAGDFDVFLEEVTVEDRRSRSFTTPGHEATLIHELQVEVVVEAPTLDVADRLYAIGPDVTVVDDLDETLAPKETEAHYHPDLRFPVGDTLRQKLRFDPPALAAKRLVRFDGSLILFADYRVLDFEFDMAEPLPQTMEREGCTVTLDMPEPAEDQAMKLQFRLSVPQPPGLEVANVWWGVANPRTMLLSSTWPPPPQPKVLLANDAGVEHELQRISAGSLEPEGGLLTYLHTGTVTDEHILGAGVARVIYRLCRKADPTKRVRFEFRDIALP